MMDYPIHEAARKLQVMTAVLKIENDYRYINDVKSRQNDFAAHVDYVSQHGLTIREESDNILLDPLKNKDTLLKDLERSFDLYKRKIRQAYLLSDVKDEELESILGIVPHTKHDVEEPRPSARPTPRQTPPVSRAYVLALSCLSAVLAVICVGAYAEGHLIISLVFLIILLVVMCFDGIKYIYTEMDDPLPLKRGPVQRRPVQIPAKVTVPRNTNITVIDNFTEDNEDSRDIELRKSRIKSDFDALASSFLHSQTNPESIIYRPLILDVTYLPTAEMVESFNKAKDAIDTVEYQDLDDVEEIVRAAVVSFKDCYDRTTSIGINMDVKRRDTAHKLLRLVLESSNDYERTSSWNKLKSLILSSGISENVVKKSAHILRETTRLQLN